MIRIGIVGVGFMGMIHYLAGRMLQGARVEAIQQRFVVLRQVLCIEYIP